MKEDKNNIKKKGEKGNKRREKEKEKEEQEVRERERDGRKKGRQMGKENEGKLEYTSGFPSTIKGKGCRIP